MASERVLQAVTDTLVVVVRLNPGWGDFWTGAIFFAVFAAILGVWGSRQ